MSARGVKTWRWRVSVVVGLFVTSGALATGLAYGFFSSPGSGYGSASVGTLKLSVNSPASVTCNYPMLSPGDLTGPAKCSLAVDYTGTIPAYVSLTVAISSQAGVGGSPLYDGTNVSGLTFSISDGQHNFTVPVGAGTTTAPCPAGFTCWTSPNDLAAWYSGPTTNLAFTASSPTTVWTVTPLFPTSAGNTYQGASANLVLTASAVSIGTPLPTACNILTIGQSCPASGSFTWG